MKHWLKFAVSFYMLEIFQVFYEVFPMRQTTLVSLQVMKQILENTFHTVFQKKEEKAIHLVPNSGKK